MGLKLAVGSSSRNARFILDRLGPGGFFDAGAGGYFCCATPRVDGATAHSFIRRAPRDGRF